MSNSIGKIYKFTTFGESHGNSLGVVIDGCPPGIKISKKIIQKELDIRKPGGKFVSPRKERDKLILLSGTFNKRTTGTPIGVIVNNLNQISKDYSNILEKFRPGHADITYFKKYNTRDYRGGGRASARTTISIVIAGSIAKFILLKYFNIKIFGYVSSIGNNKIEYLYKKSQNLIGNHIINILKKNDSLGATLRFEINNIPFGIGEPIFDKLESKISQIVTSVNAVKAIEFGKAIKSSFSKGSINNDQISNKGFLSNNNGGLLGGISNSQDINFKIYMKPTSSIPKNQNSINIYLKETNIKVIGRHDPCVGLRAIPIIEASVASIILDLILIQKSRIFI
ncbi:chorismate synthase [Candidatus Vidania fulgoroideorum]